MSLAQGVFFNPIESIEVFRFNDIRDMGSAYANSNGRAIPAAIVWKVYDGESIALQKGETLEVNTMRIGFKSALIQYQMQ